MPWQTLLVLGGIGSGAHEYAESVLAATAAPAGSADDRPLRQLAVTPAGGLAELAAALRGAEPGESLLVADLAAGLSAQAGPEPSDLDDLIAAIRACPGRLALVTTEVGLQAAPSAASHRRLAEAAGTINRAVAGAVDAVVLVVAGLPTWLKGGAAAVAPAAPAPAAVAPAPVTGPTPGLHDLTGLPLPDDGARRAAAQRTGAGLGGLAAVVEFAAGCQADPRPRPWQQVRVFAVHGDHPGAACAGDTGSAARVEALRAGTAPLTVLAARAGARVQIIETAPAEPIESGPAMPADQVEAALARGWQLAEQAADEGVDLLVLASTGGGTETAAAALTALLVPGAEPAGLLARVRTDRGTIDDAAWISRAAAVRDALRRVRSAPRGNARQWLAELGGPDLAVATGLLIGAASRRTPVLLDGPLGAAAGLAARSLAGSSRGWWLLPDSGGHPLVSRAADALALTPLLDLRLDLGEGAAALAALPLLQTALSLPPILEKLGLEAGESGGVSPRSAE